MGKKTLDLNPTHVSLSRTDVEQESFVKEVYTVGAHGEPVLDESDHIDPTKIQTLKWEMVFNPMKISQSHATPSDEHANLVSHPSVASVEYNSSPLMNYMYYKYKYATLVFRGGGDIHNQSYPTNDITNKMKGYYVDVIVYKDYTDKCVLAQTSFEEANHLPGRIRFKMRRGSKKVVRIKPALRKPYYENEYGVTTYSPCWPKTLLTGAALDQTFKGLKVWVKRPRIEHSSGGDYSCPFDIVLNHYHFINGYKPTRLLTIGKELNFNGLTDLGKTIGKAKDRLFKLNATKSMYVASSNTSDPYFDIMKNEIYKQEKILKALIMRRDMRTGPATVAYPKVYINPVTHPGNLHGSSGKDLTKWVSHVENQLDNPGVELTQHDREQYAMGDDGRTNIESVFPAVEHALNNDFVDAETQPFQTVPLDHSEAGWKYNIATKDFVYKSGDDVPIASNVSDAEKRKANEDAHKSIVFISKKRRVDPTTNTTVNNAENVTV